MHKSNIDGTLGFLLFKGTQALHRELNRNFTVKGNEITAEQWSILTFLYNCDGKSQNEIAEKTFKDKVSVTKIIDNLEKNDFVVRVSDKNDRRIKRIFLTEKGLRLIPVFKKTAQETLRKGFSGIESTEIETFKKVLSEIVKNFTGEDLLEFINTNKGRWK